MNQKIDISVIIPVYNGEKYLRKCLESILKQTFNNIEIICVDDTSTDKTLDILKQYTQIDSRIVIIKNTKNKGAGLCRNQAMERAKGTFFAFCDADDWYPDSQSLEKLYNAATKHKADIVCGSFVEYDSINKKIINKWPTLPHLSYYTIKKNGVINYRDWQMDFGWIRCLYRANFLKREKLVFPNLTRFEDPVFFVEAATKAKKIYGITDVVYCYRISHKPCRLNYRQYEDSVRGIAHNLEIAKVYHYDKLEEWCKESLIWHTFQSPMAQQIDNDLNKARDQINELQNTLKQTKDELKQTKDELKHIYDDIENVKQSRAYKTGLAITAPYRKITKKIKRG